MSTPVTPSRLAVLTASRIPTISVIERNGPTNIVVHTFPDNSIGNGHAEELFRKIAIEQVVEESGARVFDDDEIVAGIDDGLLEDGIGWELYFVQSEVSTPPVAKAS